MDISQSFASIAEFQSFWRTLTAGEQSRATTLLVLASNRLRVLGEKNDVNVDDRVEASPAYASNTKWVVMEAAKRAMLTPTDLPPVDTFQQTAGPYSENIKYTNPSGDLWFKKSELAELDLGGKQTLGSMSTSRTDIYGS